MYNLGYGVSTSGFNIRAQAVNQLVSSYGAWIPYNNGFTGSSKATFSTTVNIDIRSSGNMLGNSGWCVYNPTTKTFSGDADIGDPLLRSESGGIKTYIATYNYVAVIYLR